MATKENPKGSIMIGLAGHTNVGKTTLLRTLTRTAIGTIADKANVTSDASSVHYQALLADFLDSPGFQNAGTLITYFEIAKSAPDAAKKWRKETKVDLTFDEKAFDALKKCDVILYLGNLELVPDNLNEQEIRLAKLAQPLLIGILTKYAKAERLGKGVAKDHVNQWTGILKSNGVDQIIVFDAHWDKPSKAEEIYTAIAKILPDKKQYAFRYGLQKFKEAQSTLLDNACTLVANFVIACRSLKKMEKTYERGEDAKKLQQEVSRDLHALVLEQVTKYLKETSALYSAGFQNKNLPLEGFQTKVAYGTEVGDVAANTAMLGAGGAGAGAVLGSLVGGTLAGVVSGGLGFLAGAAIGAKIGTALGIVLGASGGAAASVGGKITAEVSERQLSELANFFVALNISLLHHGFGTGEVLDEAKFRESQKLLETVLEKQTSINWKSAGKAMMVEWCKKAILDAEE